MRTNSEASKRIRRWFLVAVSASALAAFLLQSAASRAQAPAPAPAPATGDAKAGATVFMTVGCYTCHGTVGQGGVGPRLAPNPLPMAAFANFVRNGTPAGLFSAVCPRSRRRSFLTRTWPTCELILRAFPRLDPRRTSRC